MVHRVAAQLNRCAIRGKHNDHSTVSDVAAGKKTLLSDVLAMLEFKGTPLRWTVTEFSGVGVPPAFERMDRFELQVRDSGFTMSSSELFDFSNELQDVFDICLAGFADNNEVVKITAFDSTEWSVWVDDRAATFESQDSPEQN